MNRLAAKEPTSPQEVESAQGTAWNDIDAPRSTEPSEYLPDGVSNVQALDLAVLDVLRVERAAKATPVSGPRGTAGT